MERSAILRTTRFLTLMALAGIVVISACSGADDPIDPIQLDCDLDVQFLADGGVGRDGIPSLSNPDFVPATPVTSANSYVQGSDRVIAVHVDDEWLAIPHAIMYRHEIVNMPGITVTYCPLTGSALAFTRDASGGAEFGVSGLLYQANLVMFDRNAPNESLWPQMFAEARCGPRLGTPLTPVSVVETTWDGWLQLHPDTEVLGLTPNMFNEATYRINPYGSNYDAATNEDYLGYPLPQDQRRLPKERVLGIPDGNGGGLAFPFLAMGSIGERAVFDFQHEGEPAIVIWNDAVKGAAAYRAVVNGQETTFSATSEGVVDALTGTVWSVSGTPIAGPLAGSGERLEAIASAYVAFWRAWAAFHPSTVLALEE